MRLSSWAALRSDSEQFIYNLDAGKTTWAWTEETGRKLNGREEKWTTLAVTLDQGPAKKTQEKRALLCKLKS
jgi:hypothetical protein